MKRSDSVFSLLITYHLSTLSYRMYLIVDGQCPSFQRYNLETYLGGIYYSFIPLVSHKNNAVVVALMLFPYSNDVQLDVYLSLSWQ